MVLLRPWGYCSVKITGIPKIRAPCNNLCLTLIISPKYLMTGLNLPCISQQRNTVLEDVIFPRGVSWICSSKACLAVLAHQETLGRVHRLAPRFSRRVAAPRICRQVSWPPYRLEELLGEWPVAGAMAPTRSAGRPGEAKEHRALAHGHSCRAAQGRGPHAALFPQCI